MEEAIITIEYTLWIPISEWQLDMAMSILSKNVEHFAVPCAMSVENVYAHNPIENGNLRSL